MEKPNITEGEWKIHLGPLMPDGKHIAHLGGRLEIRATNKVDNHRPNAQAISAVPEIIEELIKDYKLWLSIKNNSHDGELVELAETRLLQLQPVLKKAGVEL